MHAYRDAMHRVALDNPADDEAKIFYALAIIAAAPYGDTTYKDERLADSVLLPLARKYPTHPGVMHYIIHASDFPVLAPLALDAARRYAQLAPAIPHAQHMPSHIFIRLGLWDEVIASNTMATESGTVYEHQEKMDGEWWHNVHTMDFLQYGYLQEGRDLEAQKILDKTSRIDKLAGIGNPTLLPFYKAFFAARQLLERGQWSEAANLRLNLPVDTMSTWSGIVIAFTNAVGAARVGNPELSRAAIVRLDSLHSVLVQRKDTAGARSLGSMQTAASAWLQLALGNRDEAARLAHQAGTNENDDSEDATHTGRRARGRAHDGDRPAERRTAGFRACPSTHRTALAASLARPAPLLRRATPPLLGATTLDTSLQMAHGDGSRTELTTAKRFVAAR